jgi:hypothetical protein
MYVDPFVVLVGLKASKSLNVAGRRKSSQGYFVFQDGEYYSKFWGYFCLYFGIGHKFALAYNPQQNSPAEGMNPSLLRMARTGLVHSGVPGEQLDEAMSCSGHLLA